MKVYVLTADIYGAYGSDIELFGAFTTEEKAKKQFYLGGYIE